MWKKAMVCGAALMIAGSMIVYAQKGPGESGANVDNKGASAGDGISTLQSVRKSFNAEDMAAFTDARIAALHAGLKLNADQEKTWPAFEQALRELTTLRTDRMARDQQPSADPVIRVERLAEALSIRGSTLKRVADTLAPLYQSLDEGQKRRFRILARFMTISLPHAEIPWMGSPHGMMRGGDNFFGGRYFIDADEGMRE
jgi:zinc resistance-associated protein